MPNYGICADLSFTYQKINLRGCTDRPERRSVKEEAAEAQVAHSGNIVATIALPADPQVVPQRNARARPSRRRSRLLIHMAHFRLAVKRQVNANFNKKQRNSRECTSPHTPGRPQASQRQISCG